MTSKEASSGKISCDVQNIYDDPTFFAGYKDLRQNDTGLNGALEVPALHDLLPSLIDTHILDLGCGFGDFARYARQSGAASVTAVDVSENMLADAARLTDDSGIVYFNKTIEQYEPRPGSFDLVVSSMALHYVSDYSSVACRIFSGLKPEGVFVFSVEHPICTANPIGWLRDENGEALHWPLDHYQLEGPRETSWFVDGVTKYHRTTATYVTALLSVGFHLEHLGEPIPTAESLSRRPALKAETRRPPVLLLSASRPRCPIDPMRGSSRLCEKPR
jgi:SAM-dependent methyltransferase